MGFFDFIADAGAKVFGPDDDIEEPTKPLSQHLRENGISPDGMKFKFSGTTVIVSGTVESQEAREKAVLVIGNVKGISGVDDQLVVASQVADNTDVGEAASGGGGGGGEAPAEEWSSRTYTVQSGDTLGKIAKEMYGNAGKYPVIFEANRPMLKDPNKIYPGQVLRIPNL